MKNIQISDNDLIGRRFNGHDLHLYLQEQGIDSQQFVWNKKSDDNATHEIAKNLNNKHVLQKILSYLNKTLSTQSMFHPFSYQLLYEKKFLEADIVHYHLIHNDFFNISDFPILTKLKPTVWTLHDPWALTGHCIHPMDCDRWKTGCGDCPDLSTPKQIELDTTALNWELKKQYYSQSNFDLVVSSKWIYDKVKASPLLKDKPIHFVPFGVDLDFFKPMENIPLRSKLGIKSDNIVLCFRASKIEYKGLDIILGMLEKLNVDRSITLLAINTSKGILKKIDKKYQIIEFEWIDNDKLLVEIYNAADIFLMPSSAESFGMMAMEAMACGKPSIVMSGTALEEIVFPEQGGGIVVQQGDIPAFVSQIEELIQNDEKRYYMGKKARELAEKHYNVDRYVSDIIKVYEEVIEKREKNNESIYLIEQLLKFSSRPKKMYLEEISIAFKYKNPIKRIRQHKLIRYVYFNVFKPFMNKVIR